MNRIGTIYLLALMGLGSLDAAALEARQSPYDKIAVRNLFQLQPPVQAIVDNSVPKPQLRKIKLTGITTLFTKRVAFITIEGTKAQPDESVMLGEGQGMNGIEVKGIDEKAGVVRIVNDGELQFLDFESTKPSDLPPIPFCPKAPPNPAPPAQARITPEEQTALIELQRIKSKIEGDPIASLLPLTELTAEINDNNATTP